MWFLGVIVGLLLGATTDSASATIVLAGLGGVIAHVVTRPKKNADSATALPNDREPSQIDELRHKILSLERRLKQVEEQLANGVTIPAKPADSFAETPLDPAELLAVPPPLSTMAMSATKSAGRINAPLPESFDLQAFEDAILEEVVPEQSIGKASVAAEVPSVVKPSPLLSAQAPPAPPTQEAVVKGTPSPEQNSSPKAPPSPAPKPLKPLPPAIPLRDRLPEPISKLIYGGNTLVKMGVLILFLGLAFLLRYTAERVTVPIELRYAGVALVGAGLLGLGWFLRRRKPDYALIMQGMGVGVFYLTTLAAMKFHGLIPSELGFGFMFVVSLLGAALAILQNAPVLAIIAALEGFATPILTSTGGNHMTGLFTYLSILDVGIVLIAWFNAWRILNVIGFVGTFMLASGWANQYYTHEQYAPVQAFLILFFLLFTAVGVFFARRTLLDSKLKLHDDDSLAQRAGAVLAHVGRVDSALVFGTPLTAFGLQYVLSMPWEFGPAFSALALGAFYLLLARVIFSRERRGLALLAEAYAIVGVIFATLAIPLGFEGLWTGAAWAVEGAGMYWLGIRQNRPYARAFAYLVMIGASYKLLTTIHLNPVADGPLLLGSTIGPVLLAVSAFVAWWQHHRAEFGTEAHWEEIPSHLVLWLGMAAITVLPWQWFTPPMAAAATAAISVVAYFVARRFELKSLLPIVGCLQALAVVSFVATLHRTTSAQVNAALESGLQGMLAALIIAASILLTAGWSMAQARRTALEKGFPPDWSVTNSVSVMIGTSLLHLAMLFALSLEQAAIIWPITACAVLWVALRMSHAALAVVAGGLQLVSAGLFFYEGGFAGVPYRASELLSAYAHLQFWTPLVFALAAWLCGNWIREEDQRLLASVDSDEPEEKSNPTSGWFNYWCVQASALWLPVVWGLGWWLSAWLLETSRVLEQRHISQYLTAAAVVIVLLTSFALSALARWRDWAQMGKVSVFTLPALVLSAYPGIAGSADAGMVYLPSAYLGALAWPLALVWHLRLLKVQERWISPALCKVLHILGFWFFLLLASREGQVRFESLGEPYSSWSLLGWVLVPALSFWLLRSSLLKDRWPLSEPDGFRHTYLGVACVPVAVYLLAWCFISNVLSSGNAAPLPYLPILNPLELGQWLVLAALLLWWRALPDDSSARLSESKVKVLAAGMGWFLLTAMVLRSCHHWAGVAWDASAFFDSRLTQAALSITWSIMGVLAMLLGNRRVSRPVWFGGAALLAVVVVKLFAVELADRGGLYRIVSFIGVGVLLLVVGYFAPVPVKTSAVLEDQDDAIAKDET